MGKTIVNVPQKCGLEEALDLTGFGKYSVIMLISCCLLILALMLDIFGVSVALPAVACDLSLTTNQQGLLSAIPLMGVTISSYAWGLCADTIGRRKTLLIAMPISIFLNVISSFAPTYAALTTIKFLSASFTSSTNAAALVLLGESVSRKQRKRCMFLMATTTMSSHMMTAAIAVLVINLGFRWSIPWLNLEYQSWRLLLLIISLPGIIGTVGVTILTESPKFLLSKGKHEQAMKVMRTIYAWNSGLKEKSYPVESIIVNDRFKLNDKEESNNISFIRQMWNQTVPLFKPPLLKNSLMVYYLLMCAYMTTTGFSIWVTTVTNAFFTGDDTTGKTFCQVTSFAARPRNSTTNDCNDYIPSFTFYGVMVFSGGATLAAILVMLIVKPVGTKGTTLLVFVCSGVSGISLLFVKIPLLSIALFYIFLYVAVILGNANTYLVELNPTYLRSMAACLSVVVCRGFSFISVQLIATFLADHCTYMFIGYISLVISGFVVALFLPPDKVIEEAQKDKNGK